MLVSPPELESQTLTRLNIRLTGRRVHSRQDKKSEESVTVKLANMQNDEGETVDLYIPRKWCV